MCSSLPSWWLHISRSCSGGNDSDEDVEFSVVKEKNAQIGEQMFVNGVPVYHDGNEAPVEQVNPLGYHVSWAEILFLNASQMVGTGVFSTCEYEHC